MEKKNPATIEKHYFVPCPHCGEYIELKFSHMKWENKSPETARYECQLCGGVITDQDKPEMLKKGEWRERPDYCRALDRPDMLLWTNVLYSTVVSFSDVAREFMRSLNDHAKLRNFVEFFLAEPWEG